MARASSSPTKFPHQQLCLLVDLMLLLTLALEQKTRRGCGWPGTRY